MINNKNIIIGNKAHSLDLPIRVETQLVFMITKGMKQLISLETVAC